MRYGVGLLAETAAVTSMASSALSVASFFGGGKKKKHQITAAENRASYQQSVVRTVNAALRSIKARLAIATTVEAANSELGVLPKISARAWDKSRKNYGAIFGKAAAEAAVKNIISWQRPIYDEGQAVVKAMVTERIAMLEAPAKAAAAAAQALQMQQESESRLARKIATAVGPAGGPSTSTILLILGGLGVAWWFMKGRKT